jgi:hypothetical protein
MEGVNAFREIVNVTQKGKWYSSSDFIDLMGFHLRLAGIRWSSIKELSVILNEMVECGFLEHHYESVLKLNFRVKDMWYDNITV